MNELQVFNYNQVEVVDSREVAKLVEKQHKHLLRDIDGYIKIMEEATEPKVGPSDSFIDSYVETMRTSTELKIEPSDFFIKSTYKDSTGRTLPCYLLTKKGCDMVANKMTGEKGILFTAAYVTAFEKMQKKIACGSLEDYSAELQDLTAAVQLLTEQVETLMSRECGPAAALALPGQVIPPERAEQKRTLGIAAQRRWMRTASEKLDLMSARMDLSHNVILSQIYHIMEEKTEAVLEDERIRVMEEKDLPSCSILTAVFFNQALRDLFQDIVDYNLAPENRGW